jgi:hypothetical protein
MAREQGQPQQQAETVTERRATREQVQRSVQAMRQASAKPEPAISGAMVDQVGALLRGEATTIEPPRGGADEDEEDDASAGQGQQEQGQQGEAEGEQGEQGEQGQGDQDEGTREPPTLADLAEAMGVDKKDVYSIRVPMGQGEFVTLGELKTKAQAAGDLEAERSRFEQERETHALTSIDARRRIAATLSRLAHVPPELMQAVEADHRSELLRESAMLRQVAPEFADPTKSEAIRAQIIEALRPYGFTPGEVAAMADHRFVLAARDFAKIKAELKEAKDAARRRFKPGPNAAGAGRQAPAIKPAPNGANGAARAQTDKADRLKRIGAMLKGL